MVTIRDAEPGDEVVIADVHAASVRGLAVDDYDDRQVASWSDSEPEDFSLPADGEVPVVVAEATDASESGAGGTDAEAADPGETVAGFGAVDLESGEVRAVYVHPDHAGAGVGSAILGELEDRARAEGLTDLHLTASLNAVPFYERHGWTSTGPTEYEVGDGVELEAVEMEKSP